MLRALSGPLSGATFEVGARVLIGRVPACDVLLVDVEVSREHAMIVSERGRPTLVDLGSRNGTFMDGKRVRRVALTPGDTFTVSSSKFVFDRAAPISTTPVLSARFGVPAAPSDDEGAHPTRETPSADRAAVTSSDRETRQSMAAVSVTASPTTPTTSSPAATPGRPTVRLEAATAAAAQPPVDKPTVQLEAAKVPLDVPPEARATASLAAVTPPEPKPEFRPPPVPQQASTPLPPAAKEAEPMPSSSKTGPLYDGDLLADVTGYRSFRLRLQRGEIPSGEEVASMIDLEAKLREPQADADPRRDVLTRRFFRRFPFDAPLQARFTAGGRMVNAEGRVTNLSVDGLRCDLQLQDFTPKPDQLAMLCIEHEREGVPVRYSITARVVWNQQRIGGFVFAGVPSWSERRSDFDDAETAVRARPVLPQ